MARALRRPAGGARQLGRDRAALQPDDPARQEPPARVSHAGRRHDRRAPARRGRGRPRAASRAALSRTPPTRDAKRPQYEARLEFETKTIVPDGLRRLLPHRRRLHQLGARATACRWDRAAARARARSSRTRSASPDLDPLRYSLIFERFLNPERVSMPDFDIDFCQDGRDRVIDYVKKKYGADSVSQIATFGTLAAKAAVRDVGRVLDLPYPFVDGIAKLIPFQPGKLVTLRRRTGDADANVIYAREVEPLHQRARGRRGGSAAAARAGRAARRPAAQRRHARGRRADRAGQAHRLLPAVRAAERRRDPLAVRQGRRRGRRPREVRLPGPHDADDPRLDRPLREDARPAGDGRPRRAAARRPGGVRHLPQGQHDRRVPVRIARHARAPEAGAGDALRGHHRAGRAVPAGADGAHPGLRRAQVGPRAQRVPRSAPGADPRGDVRRHGVPGTRDEDRAGDRRLHAGRRRPAAQGDGQEEARGNGQAPVDLRRRRDEERR